MKVLYVELFGRVYNDEDVRNLIAFYESPTGRKFIEKQQQLMQESFAAMQQRMQPIMQRISRELEEATRKQFLPSGWRTWRGTAKARR